MSVPSTATQYAFPVSPRPGQGHIDNGETLISHRGEEWTFDRVSRPAQGNSSGRVQVRRPCPDYDTQQGDCPHFWHYNGVEVAEYFPSVFDLYLGTEGGEEA